MKVSWRSQVNAFQVAVDMDRVASVGDTTTLYQAAPRGVVSGGTIISLIIAAVNSNAFQACVSDR